MKFKINYNILNSMSGPSSAESSDLESSKAEVVELTDRCTNLRAMNEELMTMLEKMYAEQK